VNPSTLEDSHSVTSDRASRAELRPAYGDHLAEKQVASFPLTLALRAEMPYPRRQRAAKVIKALRLVAREPSLRSG
jgi:hypothetical protein